MKPRIVTASVLLGASFALVAITTEMPVASAAVRATAIVSVTDQGVLTETPNNVSAEDIAASARVGGKDVWIFGDTLYKPTKAVSPAAAGWRSSTSGTSSAGAPGQIAERENAAQVPYQFLPYTPAESAYNNASGDPNNRWALWASEIIPNTSSTALVPYLKTKVQPGFLAYQNAGSGIAMLSSGTAVSATRSTQFDSQGLVFQGNDPHYFGTGGGVVAGNYLYLYDCSLPANADLTVPCYVARVSAQYTSAGKTKVDWNRVNNRSLYEVWNGSKWISQGQGGANWLLQAAPIVNGGSSAFSVSYNSYLKKYVAIYMPGFSTQVMMTTAPAPEGPWSAPVKLFDAQQSTCTNCFVYNARQHPDFVAGDASGTTLLITYSRPVSTFVEETRMVKVRLTSAP